MPKDEIYLSEPAGSAPFEFNAAVADVFPDMLRRSIPGYSATIEAIGQLASRYVKPNTRCYDLGCSLAAATLAMQRNVTAEGCRIVAVDNSTAMVEVRWWTVNHKFMQDMGLRLLFAGQEHSGAAVDTTPSGGSSLHPTA